MIQNNAMITIEGQQWGADEEPQIIRLTTEGLLFSKTTAGRLHTMKVKRLALMGPAPPSGLTRMGPSPCFAVAAMKWKWFCPGLPPPLQPADALWQFGHRDLYQQSPGYPGCSWRSHPPGLFHRHQRARNSHPETGFGNSPERLTDIFQSVIMLFACLEASCAD